MTEATTPTEPPAETTPVHPADILMHLIIAFLAPMFLTASGGDIRFARMAALETVNAYRARNQIDLMAIAQIIACSLSALGSLSLAMADDISLSMTLRLRGNAVALNRAIEQNRRALAQTPEPHPEDQAEYEARVAAEVAAAQQLSRTRNAAEDQQTTETPPPPAPAITPIAPKLTDRQWQAKWATAMTEVAAEYTAGLKFLPPTERWQATRRAAALSSTANQLLLGPVPPTPPKHLS
jgi:hypothetical protein